jgi:hypothetical protein
MCFLGIGGMIKNVIPLTFIRQTTFLGASVNTRIIKLIYCLSIGVIIGKEGKNSFWLAM